MTTEATVVFVIVVGLRFLIPLFIPRWPLPAVLACLVLDGIDQSDLPGLRLRPARVPELRQGDGPVLPVHRLPVVAAELDAELGASGISRFLFFYRMVGVMPSRSPGCARCC